MLNRLFASGKVFRGKTSGMAYLSSAIPARALYHAMNAARSPKYPPAESKCWFGAPFGISLEMAEEQEEECHVEGEEEQEEGDG